MDHTEFTRLAEEASRQGLAGMNDWLQGKIMIRQLKLESPEECPKLSDFVPLAFYDLPQIEEADNGITQITSATPHTVQGNPVLRIDTLNVFLKTHFPATPSVLRQRLMMLSVRFEFSDEGAVDKQTIWSVRVLPFDVVWSILANADVV